MQEPIDPTRPDPHDPLAPRSDDPRIGRWWSSRALTRQDRGRSLFLRWPVLVLLMMLMVGLVALVVVVLSA